MMKKIGAGLREDAHVGIGDIVFFCARNKLVTPAILFGTMVAGAALTGANPAATEKGTSFVLHDRRQPSAMPAAMRRKA